MTGWLHLTKLCFGEMYTQQPIPTRRTHVFEPFYVQRLDFARWLEPGEYRAWRLIPEADAERRPRSWLISDVTFERNWQNGIDIRRNGAAVIRFCQLATKRLGLWRATPGARHRLVFEPDRYQGPPRYA